MKIAIVHDWLTNMGGAENSVLAMHEAYPEAPIYTSVYDPDNMPLFKGLDIRTTWLQKLPKSLRSLHKFFPILRIWAFKSLDLREYDLILSSSSAESKNVRKKSGAQHICYCYTPIRYYWSHYAEYRKNPGFGWLNGVVRLALPFLVPVGRKHDFRAAQNVDHFIGISCAIQSRIQQYYQKEALVIHPPVDVERFFLLAEPVKRSGFIMVGRQVPYKRMDLAVAACTRLNLPLTLFGDGSEHGRLVKMAGPTIKFVKRASNETIALALKASEGFIFPGEEDFGIVQVESLAAGTPVIAYAKGGALDIHEKDVTAIFFYEQTEEALIAAIGQLQSRIFDKSLLEKQASLFTKEHFICSLQNVINKTPLNTALSKIGNLA